MNRWALFTTLLLAGLALLLLLAIACGGLVWRPGNWLLLAGASLIGLLLRAARRKWFFHPHISLHDAFGYEVIVQCVDLMNPLMPKRAFESIFLERETRVDPARIRAWIQARTSAVPSIVAFMLATSLALTGLALPAAALLLLALLLLALNAHAWRRQHRVPTSIYVRTWLTGILVWLAECALLIAIAAQSLSPDRTSLAYLLFTGLYESIVTPFAIGMAELPALLGLWWGKAPDLLGLLLAWHICRSGIVLLLAAPYAPRFKMRKRELLQPDLVRCMRELQRRREHIAAPDEHGQLDTHLSIVIPAYNEEQRLPAYLREVCAYTARLGKPCEIIVVDDGSRDQTTERVREIQGNCPALRLLRQPQNTGKGRAIQRGVLAAKGRYILFADADGATPIREANRLLRSMESERADLAIGSRRVVAPSGVQRQRRGNRAFMSRLFFALVNVLAVPGIQDTQCGFKLFRRSAAHHLFAQLHESGWAFDVEILYKAQFAGFRIVEVPVSWSEVAGSKVAPIRDAWRMLKAIFRIRRQFAGYMTSTHGRQRHVDPS